MDSLQIPHFLMSYQWVIWPLLVAILALGSVAILSPKRFKKICHGGATWVDSKKILEVFDRSFDIDRLVLRYCRAFGVLVIVAALILVYLYSSIR